MSALSELSRRVQSTTALIERHQRTLRADSPRSALANIRSLEKLRRKLEREFEETAQQEEVDVFYYRILNPERATINGVTAAWREFQNALSAMYVSLKGGGAKKEKSKRSRRKLSEQPPKPTLKPLELGFGYAFAGSIGVTLTLPNHEKGLFSDPAIERATADIFELATSYGSSEKVWELARRFGPEPVNAVYKWVDAHVTHGYGVGIEWKRDEEHHLDLLCQFEELKSLRDDLSKTTIDTRIDVTGDLVAVDSDILTFRMRFDDGEEISGTYETAISTEQAARVPCRYAANLTKSTKVIRIEGEQQNEWYFLNHLEQL
jgi:hypothetical protein